MGDKGLNLDREETNVVHRQMTAYKGVMEKPHIRASSLILIRHVK